MHDNDDVMKNLLNAALSRRRLFERSLKGGAAVLAGGAALTGTAAAAPAGAKPAADIDAGAARRLLSGKSWDDYCEMLRLAGHQIEHWGDSITDLDRAEWYRFMTRLARNGIERFVENSDARRPRLRDAPWRNSINVQNPDQDHLLSEFSAAHDYIIRGHRGSVPYFIISAWSAAQPADIGARDWPALGVAGLKQFNPAMLRTTTFIKSDDLQMDAAGHFEVRVSQRRQPGNWLQLAPDSVGVIVRVVYHDRSREQAPQLHIERADRVAPAPLQAQDLAADLARAGQLVLGYAELVRSWWQDNFSKRPNTLQFSRQTYLSNGGVDDRQFAFGAWLKAPGEALVIRFTPPECEHWIFQLCNIWQENLDTYEDGQGYVTKFTARVEADGSVRIVIADADPGIGGNWIDAFSHSAGLMGLRLIKTEQTPAVTLHRLPLATLQQRGWGALTQESAIVSGERVQ